MSKIILKCQCGYRLQFPTIQTPKPQLEILIEYCPICHTITKQKILECWYAELTGKQSPSGKDILEGIENGFKTFATDS